VARYANPIDLVSGMMGGGIPVSANPSRRRHDPEILHGLTRALWSDYWAQQQEERGRSFSGQDIYDVAPRAPRWAQQQGRAIADGIVEANGGRSLAELYEVARSYGFSRGGKEGFGSDLGLQSVGHGVSWTDNIPYDPGAASAIRIPHAEFYP
jgi:hypothetical protein